VHPPPQNKPCEMATTVLVEGVAEPALQIVGNPDARLRDRGARCPPHPIDSEGKVHSLQLHVPPAAECLGDRPRNVCAVAVVGLDPRR